MQVGFSYLKRQFADPESILADIRSLVARTDFTLGDAVAEFEGRFAAVIGTEHAVGVNSGTDALFLSLKAAGVGPGDEVITMASTFVATVGAIVAAGATPVLVDVTPELVIDPAQMRAAITPRTKALMPVHWAGIPADMPEIMAIADEHDLIVVEDCAQGIGAKVGGQTVGTFGVAGCYSLHPLKNLNVWGDGGVIATNSTEFADRLRLLRNHGLSDRDTVQCWGYNSRLDTLQAIVGNHLIQTFDFITDRRREVGHRLDAGLGKIEQITIPPRAPEKHLVFHLYIVEAERRDELVSFLIERGVRAKVHYPTPLHLQPASEPFGYSRGDFPVAERQAERIFSLPNHQHLTDVEVDYMIEQVEAFYAER